MSDISSTIQFLLSDIVDFHKALEQAFVMEKGIHDQGLLESAVHTPFQTFGGIDLYPSVFDKAARLCYGLAKDHPFHDGNKHTALHSMLVYLGVHDIYLRYDAATMEKIIISVADGSMSADELSLWLKNNHVRV